MAAPAYIITPNYYENNAVDDVQDILDDLDTILAANGWTVGGAGGPYTTPADPWGRYFTLTFVRTSATRLQCTMTDDQLRSTVQRAMQITGTQLIRYYYGTRYLLIENTNQDDYIHASLLSLNPDTETAHDKYCVFATSRETGGGYNNGYCGIYDQVNAASAYFGQSGQGVMFKSNGAPFDGSIYENSFIHISGARRWHSCWLFGIDDGSTWGLRGRLYNALLGHLSYIIYGSEYTVPIDEATTGTFKVVRVPNSTGNMRMAMRKS